MFYSLYKNFITRLKNKVYKYPLSSQVKIANGIIVLTTLILIITITYFNMLNIKKQDFNESGVIVLREISDKVNSRFKLIENTISMISNDSKILRYDTFIDDEITKYLNDCINFNKYEENLGDTTNTVNLIDDIIFVTDKNTYIARKLHFTSYNIYKQIDFKWFESANNNKKNIVWSTLFYNKSTESILKNTEKDTKGFSYQFIAIKYVFNVKTFDELGYIIITSNSVNLSDLISNVKSDKNDMLFVVDNKGKIIASKNQDKILKNIKLDINTQNFIFNKDTSKKSIEGLIDNEICLIQYSNLSINNWKLVRAVPKKEFSRDISSTMYSVLIIGIMSFMLVTYMSTQILNNLSKPLKEIVYTIKKTREGNLKQKLNIIGSIEIEELSIEYNIMIDKINKLLEKIVLDQNQLRISELKALRAQINPHFLYNTLDSIKWLILSGESQKASEISSSLSNFFRIGLSGGNDEITIIQEIQHIKEYLNIQKLRCGDRLKYLIDFDTEIEECKIIKLILQPIVENAIIHGIDKKESVGVIKVIANKKENNIQFVISDNGIGMDEITLDKLNNRINKIHKIATGKHGYAIKNVNNRMKLAYGEKYGIIYKSKLNIGTKAIITIPYRTK